MLLVLLGIGKLGPDVKIPSHATVVDLLPESHSAQAERHAKKSQSKRSERQHPQAKVVAPRPAPAIKLPPPPASSPLIEMSKADLDASDLRNLSSDRGDSEVVGRGPHGETLYAAEWARRPTDAELGGYLPRNATDGYGLIACKTVPGDRVEDCVELDQEPRGSHFASAVRQAAWQFRIRPPRKNGVPLVGSWVSIRIDYIFRGASGG